MNEIIVVAIVFGSGLAALKLILDFIHVKRAGKVGSADRSLTTTELNEMIDDAVARSVHDMQRRIENLEAIVVDEPVLPAHRVEDRIELPDEPVEDAAEGRVGRRVRS